jgi:hypothetical protein
MVNGQWSMVNGQWSMVNGQWSMVNGQWSTFIDYPRSQALTIDYQPTAIHYPLIDGKRIATTTGSDRSLIMKAKTTAHKIL